MTTIREKAEAVKANVQLWGDKEAIADFVLRITSPEMRERIAAVLMENSAMNEGSAAKHARDIMGLLTEEP